MTTNIIGDTSLIATPSIIGTQPTPAMMPLTIQALVNRPTLATTIRAYLENGFDWCKWVRPKVARFPRGHVPSEKFQMNFHLGEDGRLYALLDGDHRKHMFILTFPQAAVFPVQVIDVDDEEHYHELFVEINFSNRKNANPNEVFLHLVLAGDSDAVLVAKILDYCGVGVQGSPEPGGIVGCTTGPLVNVSNFKTALKLVNNDSEAIKNACADINSTWPLTAGQDKIAGDLLGGVSVVRKYYPEITTSVKMEAEWEKWLTAQSGYSTKDRARDFKISGGDVGNKQGEAVAYGIIKDFKKFSGGCISSGYKAKKLPESRMIKLLGI